MGSALSQMYPPKSKFSVDQVPDLSGKVIIVTGGNNGVGKETTKILLSHNAKVYMASRSQERAEKAIRELKDLTGGTAIFLKLDLADLKSVKAAAEEFLSKESRLDVLYNNGGILAPPVDHLTVQGYDAQFGTNVIGHYYFTKLLLPILISTAKSNPDWKARVVTTSSFAERFGKVDIELIKDTPLRRKTSPHDLYNHSKLGNIVFANELARRYGDQGIVSMSLNPGNTRTDLNRHLPKWQQSLLDFLFLHPISYASLTLLYGGVSPEGANFNGKYLIPWARVGEPKGADANDRGVAKKLWEWMDEQVQNV